MQSADSDALFRETAGEHTLSQGLGAGLWRSKWWILLLVLVGTAFGAYLSLGQPNTYESMGKLLLRLGSREQRSPESAVQGDFGGAYSARGSPIRDEIHLLNDIDMYRSVARQIGPDVVLKPYDPFARDNKNTPVLTRWVHGLQAMINPSFDLSSLPQSERLVDVAAARLQACVGIVSDPSSNVMLVTCRVESPQLAKTIVDAVLHACQERHREVFATTPQLEFVSDQLKQATEKASAASLAYADYRQQCGVYDITAQSTALSKDILNLQSEVEQNGIHLEELDVQIDLVNKDLASTPEKIEQPVPAQVTTNPDYNSLANQLRDLNEQLAELSASYAPGSAAYESRQKYLTHRIASLEAERAATPRTIQMSEAGSTLLPNPRHEQLIERKADLSLERAKVLVSISRSGEMQERLQKQMDHLLTCEPEHNRLEFDSKQKEERAQQMLGAYNRAQTMGMIDKNEQMGNLLVIQNASTPGEKVGPHRGQILGLGIFGGLVAGVLVAILRMRLDSKLRDPNRVEAVLGVPLLGVFPETRAWARISHGLRRRVDAGVPSA